MICLHYLDFESATLSVTVISISQEKSTTLRKAKSSGIWHLSKEVKRNIRKAEWNHVNNIIKDNLDQNNANSFFSYCKSKRQDNIGVGPLKFKGNLVDATVSIDPSLCSVTDGRHFLSN